MCLAACWAFSGAAVAGSPASSSIDAPTAADSTTPARHWGLSGAPALDGYRWSLSRGSIDLGVHFEARPAAAHPLDGRYDSAAPMGASLPSLSLGLRSVDSGPASANTLVERALGSTSAAPYVGKVAIEYKPAQSQVFLRQGLGFRLSGDDRVTMRLRKGSLGIYMHANF